MNTVIDFWSKATKQMLDLWQQSPYVEQQLDKALKDKQIDQASHDKIKKIYDEMYEMNVALAHIQTDAMLALSREMLSPSAKTAENVLKISNDYAQALQKKLHNTRL